MVLLIHWFSHVSINFWCYKFQSSHLRGKDYAPLCSWTAMFLMCICIYVAIFVCLTYNVGPSFELALINDTDIWMCLSFFGGGSMEEEEKIVKGDDVIVDLDATLEDLYMGGSLKVRSHLIYQPMLRVQAINLYIFQCAMSLCCSIMLFLNFCNILNIIMP